ncbi:PREDICTED: flavonoid 3'-monooxygenase isoform X3 [Tarenaya hassleriana]|uniref:flavonoid 3'-monooxygenase isoform X3 n=1 Tax=Tarenaya hassleriana TaxID=28532 RepID=UPI00053C3AF6|nr:PREDICTED: flavonoid 3'-monooxygenase isoform X3 [Tarenaya hassleriana]XP_010522783.1 PREDICTED: flavonoid 3'-monooxygenase isoform X3 [Tarenaya hassleriana]
MGPKPHRNLTTMVATYGPLLHLRLGFVDVVVASSKAVAEQFLRVHDSNFASRPPNSGAKHIAYNYQDLVFAPYGQRWRMLRKISSVHLFSAKALEDSRHVRQEEVGAFTRELARAKTNPVNLSQLVNVCVVNALGRVMIGRRLFGVGADPRAEEFKSMVTEMMSLAGVFNVGDFIPALDWLDLQGVAAKMKRLHKRFDGFLSSILEEHEINGPDENKSDMLSTLISLKGKDLDGDGSTLTDTEIKALLLNMFSAGTDTSSSTVEWTVAELIRHPEIMGRAQQELDSVVGRNRPVSESDLPNLPYLQDPCQICGSVGYEDLIITCFQCREVREHIYCARVPLPSIPDIWLCEVCRSSNGIIQTMAAKEDRTLMGLTINASERGPDFVSKPENSSSACRKRSHKTSKLRTHNVEDVAEPICVSARSSSGFHMPSEGLETHKRLEVMGKEARVFSEQRPLSEAFPPPRKKGRMLRLAGNTCSADVGVKTIA